jgi:cysteine desulfurase
LHRDARQPVRRLLVSAIEHTSVLSGGRFSPETIDAVEVTGAGLIDLDRLREHLAAGPPALVSVMLANNETGAVQPILEVADVVHEAGGLLHVDSIQALGKMPFDIKSMGADLITLSAHKVGGPKGVGALVVAEDVQGLAPLLRGGGQELGRRAGTENVAGIAAFGAATAAAMTTLAEDTPRLQALRDQLEKGLMQTAGMIVFSTGTPRLPNTTLFTVPGLKAETAVIGFDLAGIAVSSGSACSSGKVQPSHVLAAMGVGRELAQGAVRLSLGWSTSETDIDLALKAWRKLADALLRGRRNTA